MNGSAPAPVIGYASRTGTRRNLAELRAAGWRLLVSARGAWRTERFPYAIDNGAWTAYQRGEAFDESAFLGVLEQLGCGADWIVVPDIVCGGLESLRFSEAWLPRLDAYPRLLVAVQDGITPEDIAPLLTRRIGLFVGGSTTWKERSVPAWADLALRKDCWLHVGRVNTARRLRICQLAGATSVDGSGPSRYSRCLGRLETVRRQLPLPLDGPESGAPLSLSPAGLTRRRGR